MNQIMNVAKVILPNFLAVSLGVLARSKKLLTPEECQGLQKFVLKFGLPCVLFNSCLTADIGGESLGTMAMLLPFIILAALWSFRGRAKHFPYHNFPMLFAAQETGMLGIPLFMILFGAERAYYMGILDLTQMVTAYPVIAILSSGGEENPSLKSILKGMVSSPLMLMSMAGLFLNITGLGAVLDQVGIGAVIQETTGFLAQPVSALMIFCVGYNFSLAEGSRNVVFRISVVHFIMFAIIGGLVQLLLFLIPDVDSYTRWAILLYSVLPASYLAPGFGKRNEDITVTSGVCSVLTAVSLLIFCVMAAITA